MRVLHRSVCGRNRVTAFNETAAMHTPTQCPFQLTPDVVNSAGGGGGRRRSNRHSSQKPHRLAGTRTTTVSLRLYLSECDVSVPDELLCTLPPSSPAYGRITRAPERVTHVAVAVPADGICRPHLCPASSPAPSGLWVSREVLILCGN